MVDSILDEIDGLGPVRKKSLIAHFGSLKRLKLASVPELESVPGIGPVQAQEIFDALQTKKSPEPTINMTTGEIIDQ